MRRIIFALALAGAGLAFQSPQVEAREGPWCLIGYNGSGNSRGDCSYPSYAACQATASGLNAYCDRNYYYQGNIETDAPPYAPPRRRRAAPY